MAIKTKAAQYRHFSVMVPEGGQLIAGNNSQDTAGASNYVEKLNFRRESDGEVRREGWEKFKISDTEVDQIDSSNNPIRLLFQFNSNEKKVLVGGAGDKLYRFDSPSSSWVKIAEDLYNIDNIGVSPTHGLQAKRWECVAIDGYCIFNNGVDLPLFYREDWPCAFPLFSLRERGIVRVGTISEFDGRLFVADVEYFDETIENNYEYFMSAASYPFGLPEKFVINADQQDIDNGHAQYINQIINAYDAYITTYRVPHIVEFSAWRLTLNETEARAAPNLFGQIYKGKVSGISSGSITKITIPFQLGGTVDIVNGVPDFSSSFTANPYYTFTSTQLNEWDFDACTIKENDVVRISITTNRINYVYDGRVKSLKGSWLNSNTELEIDDFVEVEGVTSATGLETSTGHTPIINDEVQFILLKEPDVFSSNASVAREAADSISFPEDGSKILKMAKLSDKLIVHRETGYLQISRGDSISPFYYEEKYRGERIADFYHTIININEQRQIFAGFNGVYSITLGSFEPEPVQAFMQGPEFWRLILDTDIQFVYASENALTQEIFIASPIGYKDRYKLDLDWGTIALEMVYGTISQIDFSFTATANLNVSENIKSRQFIMGTHAVKEIVDGRNKTYTPMEKLNTSEVISDEDLVYADTGSRIMRYGLGPSTEIPDPDDALKYGAIRVYRLFSRDGADFISRIKFGKTDFQDRFSEKKLKSFALHMSDIYQDRSYVVYGYVETDYSDAPILATVGISTFSVASASEYKEVEEVLTNLSSEVMIPVYAQGNYFQDTIELRGRYNAFKLIGRTFEVSGVRTRLTSESVGEVSSA